MRPTRRQRLRSAEQLFRSSPGSPRAWYWQVQIKVLTFFLSVYGDFEQPPKTRRSFPSTPVGMGSRDARRQKTPAELRTILESIAEANREMIGGAQHGRSGSPPSSALLLS